MRRKVGLFLVCAFALPLVVAATASAQGATLQVSDQQPAPGQQVLVTGNGFSSGAGRTPVSIRLSSRTGRELASATPTAGGLISTNVLIPPNLQPGWYLLVGTQEIEANRRAAPFTPGRTRIRVRAASAGAVAPPPGGRGGLPGSPLGLLAMGSALVALATGATLTARRLRTADRPQLGS